MDEAERAEARRRRWRMGVIRPDMDAAAAKVAFCRSGPPEGRLEALAELVRQAWSLEHPDEPLPRLDRSVFGVRRGGR